MVNIRSGKFSDQNDFASRGDQCARAFLTQLEGVVVSDFYKNTTTLPQEGTEVKVVFDKRLLVVDQNNVGIGYLPVKYNYLTACMCDGFTYKGVVDHIIATPVPYIIVEITPCVL